MSGCSLKNAYTLASMAKFVNLCYCGGIAVYATDAVIGGQSLKEGSHKTPAK
jgi:hypothetical protein